MLRITLFELKKMLSRRVALVANAAVLVMLVGIMALNVIQARTTTENGMTVLSGPAAITAMREEKEAHAQQLPAERISEDLASYRALAFSRVAPEDVLGITDAAAYSLMHQTYDAETFDEIYDPYWAWLTSPFGRRGEEPYQTVARLSDEEAASWYDAVANLAQGALDDGQGGSWEYSETERAYWTQMEASVHEPLSYGWAGAWENVIDCAAFLIFPMIAICLTLAPTFAGEYQDGTDAVLLATRWGRSRLLAAKLVAALAYTLALMAAGSLVIVGASVAFYGAEGFDLPVQAISLGSPYPISCGQAALISVGLMWVCALGVAAITLAFSARMRSTLPVFAVGVALLLLTGMIPTGGNGVLMHALLLFPMNFGNFSSLFSSLTSYPAGPAVVDLIGMIVVVWLAVLAVGTPTAAVSWRRHQVA